MNAIAAALTHNREPFERVRDGILYEDIMASNPNIFDFTEQREGVDFYLSKNPDKNGPQLRKKEGYVPPYLFVGRGKMPSSGDILRIAIKDRVVDLMTHETGDYGGGLWYAELSWDIDVTEKLIQAEARSF